MVDLVGSPHRRWVSFTGVVLACALPSSCSGGGGGGGGGHLDLLEIRWGKLVDVRDSTGTSTARDLLVEGGIVSNLVDLVVETQPITERATATILFTEGSPEYAQLFASFDDQLGFVTKKFESSPPPYSMVPRNAALLLWFDQPVDPKSVTEETIRLFAGGPGGTELEARRFVARNDPRAVVVDLAISPLEAQATGLAPNASGLPASSADSVANVQLRIPTQFDPAVGQTKLLKSASGGQVQDDPVVAGLSDDGPDLVRAFRSGGPTALTGDPYEGFVPDTDPPEIVGAQPVTITSVAALGEDRQEIQFAFDLAACSFAPEPGDVLQQGTAMSLVVGVAAAIPPTVVVEGVRWEEEAAPPPLEPGAALFHLPYEDADAAKAACFVTFYPLPSSPPATGIDPTSVARVRFSEPMDTRSVLALETVTLTKDDPGIPGPGALPPSSFVVGELADMEERREFTYVPSVPIPHAVPQPETRYLSIRTGAGGVRDSAGNPLIVSPFTVAFTMDPAAATADTGGFALRFESPNETNGSLGLPDLEGRPEVGGQVTFVPGELLGRPVLRFSRAADWGNPFVGVANQFNFPIGTPLSPYGSRLMTLWRHVDLGVSLQNPAEINLDVERLYWTPFLGPPGIGGPGDGQVFADGFPRFRIDLAHSYYFPDEIHNGGGTLLPQLPTSGILSPLFHPTMGPPANNGFGSFGNPFAFWGNPEAEPPAGPPVTVYDGPYTINPASLVLSPGTNTPMMPYPDLATTYTWRDSGFPYSLKGGPLNQGLEPLQWNIVHGPGSRPFVVATGKLPSVALPLLLQYRNYPLDPMGPLGANGLQMSVMVTSSSKPNFRLYSTGGYNVQGNLVLKDPDSNMATGGFNPASTPPGLPTLIDGPEFYWGQADFVVRVSRAFTHWFDTGATGTVAYAAPVLEPLAEHLPPGTQVRVEFRGADLVSADPCPLGASPTGPASLPLEDASGANVYGVYTTGNLDEGIWFPIGGTPCPQVVGVVPPFPGNPSKYQREWTSDLAALDGKRFLQMRFTFVSNIDTGDVSRLSAVGIGYFR